MKPTLAFCESDTHAAMICELQRRSLLPVDHVLATGRFPRLDATNLPVTLFTPDPSLPPAEVWQQAQSVALGLLDRRDLVQFQDQGWMAEAVSMAGKSAGAYRTLIQDGYLTFDTARAFGPRRFLWPLTSKLDWLPLRTPRPRLRVWLNRFLYRQHYFGITRPDRALVFGEAMKDRLVRQFGMDDTSVHVTGPLLRPDSLQTDYTPPAPDRPLRVLFLDQCFLRYRRMSRKAWQENYLPLIRSLSGFDLTVKLHPSQPGVDGADVIKSAGPQAVIAGNDRLPETLSLPADVAVTVSSTAFIACLAAGVPVIFCDCGALDRMPKIRHELVANTENSEATSAALQRFHKTGIFPLNTTGDPLCRHLFMPGADKFPNALRL
ncbi:hypothetical protein [Hyphomonas adhaerens]|uniref:hypothetical protein n=1 Tax=Hyphomonas adhaerens TaxID=81029 RepID=UPI002352B0CF|nr:hypothetical protein [Hyphomonas adhaerens]